MKNSSINLPSNLAKRGVHLDLKGFPPTPERLLDWVELAAACGYNLLLVEWEDQFPWTDARFRGPTCYTTDDVRRLMDAADRLGIEVVPLVQCLGHLEFVLRHDGMEHLREQPMDLDVLNPLAPGARELVEQLVDDVLRLSPNVRHFHLGGDEAWTFGSHPDTRAFIQAHGPGALYLQHVEPLLDHLHRRAIRPILWHDMMIGWDDDALRQLGGQCDLMVWGYQGDPQTTDGHYQLKHVQRFADAGVPLWAATAWKGADLMEGDLPDPARRAANALAWARHARAFHMRGVVATGWSRYSAGRVQCDPNDAALDCMALVGAILHTGELPEGGIEACRARLRNMPGGAPFTACYESVHAFSEACRSAWELIRGKAMQHWLSETDLQRDPHLPAMHHQRVRAEVLARMQAAGDRVHRAFAGLCDDRWIEEFIQSRAAPIRALLAAGETVNSPSGAL